MSGHKTRKISKNDLQQKEKAFSLSADMIEGILNVANSENSQLLQENELIAKRYRVIKKLGDGGMGFVYQVKDESNHGQVVALKITIAEVGTSDTNKRFSREIEMMRQLQHPNIMEIYDSGEHENQLFYTMEYIEGKPFYEFLWQDFTIEKGIKLIAQVAQAVHFAHENNIVHRDLKPDNIMITKDLRPILMDFGIAKIVEYHTQLTKSGFVMGTPFYMSPEQALGNEVDHLSDVYALGVILYEFITGSLPFTGKSNKETLSAVVHDFPMSPMGINIKVDTKLNDICLKALRKNKKERYTSAREFAVELEKYLSNNGTINNHRRKWLVLTNIVLLMVLALLVYYFTLQYSLDLYKRCCMNFVFISPHFPPNYANFCLQLHKLGVNVLGIGDSPYETLDQSLKKTLTEYYYIPNMENYDEILRACGYFTHRYGKIDRIESNNEHWLETDARLRDDFNVFGVRSHDVQRIKFKSHMKEEFRKANVNVPRGYVVRDIHEAYHLINEVNYPVVAKPNKGVGAVGTYKIENEQQLQHFFSIKDEHPYIMEEYIDGKICSFDGLLDRNGNAVFYTVHQNCDNVMDIVHHNLHTAYYSLRHVDDDIREQGLKILDILGLPERFFHLEFFRRANGELVVLEINMRPPGGLTLDMFNYANDIDIYREWANVMVHNHFESSYSRPYHCAYICRKFDRGYTHTHEQILQHYSPWIVHHTALAPMFWKAMGNYAYLVRDPNLDNIFEIKNYIHQQQGNL